MLDLHPAREIAFPNGPPESTDQSYSDTIITHTERLRHYLTRLPEQGTAAAYGG